MSIDKRFEGTHFHKTLQEHAERMKGKENLVGGFERAIGEAIPSISGDIYSKYTGEAMGILEMIGLNERQEEAIKKGLKRAFREAAEHVDTILELEIGRLAIAYEKDIAAACGQEE